MKRKIAFISFISLLLVFVVGFSPVMAGLTRGDPEWQREMDCDQTKRQMTFGDTNIAYAFGETIWNTRGYETENYPDQSHTSVETTWEKKWYDPEEEDEKVLEQRVDTNYYEHNGGDPYYHWVSIWRLYFNGELVDETENSGSGLITKLEK